MGGFPTWTLIGMGISAGLAVIFTAMAYIAQSPALLARLRLAGSDFSQSSRRLTGLGLAGTLLGLGFFMAGVPIGEQQLAAPTEAVAAVTAPSDQLIAQDGDETSSIVDVDDSVVSDLIETEGEAEPQSGGFGAAAPREESAGEESAEPVSGAFGQAAGPSEEEATEEESGDGEEDATATPEPTEAVAVSTDEPEPTNTPTPTFTPTPIPTATPTPTITPTAIKADTISVEFDGSVTWVYRVPGNNRLELINNGDALLLESGRAMVQGVTWQEVRLLDGRAGWIQLSFLNLGEEE